MLCYEILFFFACFFSSLLCGDEKARSATNGNKPHFFRFKHPPPSPHLFFPALRVTNHFYCDATKNLSFLFFFFAFAPHPHIPHSPTPPSVITSSFRTNLKLTFQFRCFIRLCAVYSFFFFQRPKTLLPDCFRRLCLRHFSFSRLQWLGLIPFFFFYLFSLIPPLSLSSTSLTQYGFPPPFKLRFFPLSQLVAACVLSFL